MFFYSRWLAETNKWGMEGCSKLQFVMMKRNIESKADEEQRNLLHDVNKYVRAAAGCVAMDDV